MALVVKDVIVNLGICNRLDKIESGLSHLNDKVVHSTNVMLNVHGFLTNHFGDANESKEESQKEAAD